MFEKNPKLKNIFFINFLLSFHFALTAYIGSSFLSLLINEKSVGLIYVAGSVVSILALLLAPKIFSSLGGQKFLLMTAGIIIICLLLLFFRINVTLTISVFVLYIATNTLIVFSLDELFKIFSKVASTGKTRGLYFAIGSFAWVIAQFLFFAYLGKFSLEMIYLFACGIMLLLFFVSLFSLDNVPDPKYGKANIFNNIREFLKNKNLFRSYGINFLLQFFYAWMIIYTPIYLSAHLGFSWREIGIIFAIMLIPFSILPFSLGKYADRIGERRILMFGFFVTSITTIALFFIFDPEVWKWALVLFWTRVGAATIESMSDIYFFKHIKPENEEFIGVYRSAAPVAFIIGPAVALLVMLSVPEFKYMYIVLGAFTLYGVYLASTIKKSDI